MDPSQFGNQKGLSIEHYLVKMIHKILMSLDNNSKGEIFAVIASLVDWKQAFNRQDATLGIRSFMDNGVRPAMIPMLINYFQGRKGFVKWKGQQSDTKPITGGGPQGGFFGILEFLSQPNDNAEMVEPEDSFKFVDDLTTLEIIDLLITEISTYDIREHVP